MQLMVKGIPSIYYGEEIGMLNPGFTDKSQFRDVDVFNSYKNLVDEQKIYSEEELTKYHSINSRDNCRTPMQ
jgi:oligo-1,6-glucosidase/alpha-glucosidase